MMIMVMKVTNIYKHMLNFQGTRNENATYSGFLKESNPKITLRGKTGLQSTQTVYTHILVILDYH